MIFVGLLNTLFIVLYTITAPFRLLPDVSLPSYFTTMISSVNGYLASLNTIVPIDMLLTLLQLYIYIEASYWAYKFVMLLIRRIPTQS